MADQLMYTKNHSVGDNTGLKLLVTQLNKPANQNSIQVLKVVKPKNKKTLL